MSRCEPSRKLGQGFAPKYVLNMGATLHRALEVAVRWGLIPKNPAKLADRPKADRKPLDVPTPPQVLQFLEAVRDHRLHGLFVLLATAGLRLGEALGLQWADVNLDEGFLQVRHQLQWTDKPALVPPKSARSRRRVELMPLAVDALRKHRARQAAERLKVGPAWQDLGLVFTTEIGTPLNPSNVRNRAFYPLLRQAGLPKVRLHDLRHFTASAMLQAGIHPRMVMEQLGHSQISVTLDLYSHLWPGAMKEAAHRTQDFLTAHRTP